MFCFSNTLKHMATKLIIDGGAPLNGTIAIDSSKNALLPIIAATILTRGLTVLKNVPKISDIENLLHILVSLGIRVKWQDGDLYIDTSEIADSRLQTAGEVSPTVAGKIRGSIFVLGAILGRFKTATVPYPGGCAIGSRPIDLHLQGLRDLGVRVVERNGLIVCKKPNRSLLSATCYLDFPSVGATENLILTSVLGKTRTRIYNAAREPEVVDLCNFLNACGAMICGHGTSTITITGVAALHGTTYTAIPDRINTASYLIAAATCGGEVTLTNTVAEHNANLINKLVKAGSNIKIDGDKITITHHTLGLPRYARNDRRTPSLRAVAKQSQISIHTSPYPGFPTDIQSQLAVFLATRRGTSTITENLFENRFKYVPELQKLGSKICVKDKSVIITGVKKLNASSDERLPLALTASDLRGGVALVIAALAAKGTSIIHNAEYIYRGHAAIERDLVALGANIIRVDM